MLDPSAVPSVAQNEVLARFVMYSKHIASDGTIKQDAFVPHPHVELSVTRHLQATERELWTEGDRVAKLRNRSLYGRADTFASTFTAEGLSADPDPIIPENPNHTNITGWPPEKPLQKIKALQIASKSQYLPAPETGAPNSVPAPEVDSQCQSPISGSGRDPSLSKLFWIALAFAVCLAAFLAQRFT